MISKIQKHNTSNLSDETDLREGTDQQNTEWQKTNRSQKWSLYFMWYSYSKIVWQLIVVPLGEYPIYMNSSNPEPINYLSRYQNMWQYEYNDH
jgi:hypothetical protein